MDVGDDESFTELWHAKGEGPVTVSFIKRGACADQVDPGIAGFEWEGVPISIEELDWLVLADGLPSNGVSLAVAEENGVAAGGVIPHSNGMQHAGIFGVVGICHDYVRKANCSFVKRSTSGIISS